MATYTVKKGDTLSAIAKQHGTTYQEIAKANGISDPNKIYAGQTLNIGGTAQTTAPKTTTTPAATTQAATNTNNGGFTYTDPNENDTVKQALAMIQQQMNNKPGEFQFANQGQLDEAWNKYNNGEKFSYDLNGDALYQQYKDQYQLQGKLGSMDVMGQAAAMNGGYGSSYGQTVGHQTYQGYLQQLNDRVPELYQLALNQYNQERQDLKDTISLLSQQKEQEYGVHRDGVSDWKDMLQYSTDNYNTLYDRVVDQQSIKYQLSRDAIEDANTAKSDASELALSMLSLGTMPSAELLAASGISNADAQTIMNAAKEQIAASAAASASSSSKKTGDGDNYKGGTFSSVLWKPTGTYDDNGNQIFRNSDDKTQAFGVGVNPYIGDVHEDAKTNGKYDPSKVFKDNGYQPNNINGTKLERAIGKNGLPIRTDITGRDQQIWKANGRYYLWRGDLNRYVEVPESDLDL